MAIKARLSVAGLYNYDSTLFDNWQLPEGVDREALTSAVLEECYGFDTAFPDIDLFKRILLQWSKRKLPIWTKLLNTTTLEYNPIENYDRMETRTLNESATSSATATDENSTTDSATGFNSDTLQVTASTSGTSESGSTNSGQRESSENARIHGNIGVTTTQQMLQSEREVARFDIYAEIVSDFIDKFCVAIY